MCVWQRVNSLEILAVGPREPFDVANVIEVDVELGGHRAGVHSCEIEQCDVVEMQLIGEMIGWKGVVLESDDGHG